MEDEGATFRFRRFLRDVRGSFQMWGLADVSGWASATLKTHPGRQTFYFWSKPGYAAAWAHDDWKNCTPRSINLLQFLNASAEEMRRRRCLIAPNWLPIEGGLVIEVGQFQDALDSRARDWDVFMSYAREDQDEVALPLVRALRRLGMMVWLDLKDMPTLSSPTDTQLHPILSTAIGQALGFILVLSPSSLLKPWPRHEFEYVLNMCRARDAQVFLVWHGLKPDLRRENVAMLQAAAREVTSFESGQDVERIAHEIAHRLPPVPRLRLEQYDGWTSVGIDRDAGEIVVWNIPEGMGVSDLSIHEFEWSAISWIFAACSGRPS
ncbi:MAG TPA: DUF2750 domain-containing protein [Thermoanaerobaculia bacterium]|nr:DUF2750 domain-containing protein [Thermoanaerobaculia bacterium]